MEKIGDVFVYDESSRTCLRWKVDRLCGNGNRIKSVVKGQEAGSLDARGEAFTTRFNGKAMKVHNIVVALHNLTVNEGEIVDHLDGDPTNNKIDNLRVVTQVLNSHNRCMQENNTSGQVGVNLWTDQRGSLFWMARWQVCAGRRKEKSFSVSKFGSDVAYQLACDYRKAMIEALNKEGHGYTKRHGTQQ